MSSAAVCSTCGTPLPPGSDRCPRCGTLAGDHRRCYGCGARAEVVQRDGLFVCAACGRPRVPMEGAGIVRSGRERAPLARIAQLKHDANVSRFVSIVGFVVAFFVLMLGAGFVSFLPIFGYAIMAIAAIIVGAGLVGLGRSKSRLKEGRVAMEEAIALVAHDVIRSRGSISAQQLAEQMGLPYDLAERTLDRLPADPQLRVETVIDEQSTDGKLRYRIADAGLYAAAVDENLSEEEQEKRSFDARLAASMKAKKP